MLDPRTLVPLDRKAIIKSVKKTGRLVIADESQLTCGVASEIAAIVAEDAHAALKAPVKRVGIPNVPVPFHLHEEEFITPTAEKIVAAVRSITKDLG